MALIEIAGLTKLYRMGDSIVRALDGVDLVIEAGEFVAITGASGSGKSTMMHLLGCLDRPTGGTFKLDGRDISCLSERELARIRNRYVGFVFQTFNLINRTPALDNVAVPLFYARRLASRTPALQALERVGLGRRAHHRPSELSGGERQRVAIARAIVNDPKLLLADEPTGNLDTRTGEQIMEIFHGLNEQGVTVILVTHEADIAAQAKRIVQMRDGRIVSDKPGPNLRPGSHPAVDVHAAALSDGSPGAPAADPAVNGQAEALGPPRRLRGSTLAAAVGWLSLILASGYSVLRPIALQKVAALGIEKFTRETKLPPEVLGWMAAAGGSLALGLLLALVAILWGRSLRRRVQQVPANWVGAGSARRAITLGLLAVVAAILGLGVPMVRRALGV